MKMRTIGLIVVIIALGVAAHIAAGGEEAAHHSGGHWSIASEIIPESLEHNIRGMLGPTWIDHNENYEINHVFFGLIVFIVGIGLAIAANRKLRSSEDSFMPQKKWSALAFFDVLIEAVLNMMGQMMPRAEALRYLPVVAAFAVFILISNVMGLIPGFLPATDTLDTTFALGAVAFLLYNYAGIRKQGLVNHLKHFMGPIPWLAPLMLPIELISHLVRPCSLAIRLMGNMFGDHAVLTGFLAFHLIFVPWPVMLLGLLVCIVQTLVFTLLVIVYIALAVEEHEHEEHAEGQPAHAH